MLLEDRGGGVRHDPREPSDDVIGRAFHRQEGGEGDEEEEERKEREEEVIGELRRLVGGRMVDPVLVELPGEPPEAKLAQARDPHLRSKLGPHGR